MKFQDCKKTDESFTHISLDGGEITVINSTRVFQWAVENKLELRYVQVSADLAETVRTQNGVNMAHVAKVPFERLSVPLTLLEWGDGTQVMADGNHRYVRAHQIGIQDLPAYFVPEEGWRQFVIDDLPPQLLEFLVSDANRTAHANSH